MLTGDVALYFDQLVIVILRTENSVHFE